ncbi:HupE/UreJ family protein [Hyalangium versicolor]|uniref:HupE/UreJ family protein n=1 Tax=Hyalangium versicolor TaxID=2861190 RepID=UPI001CCB7E0C|nr:HupE/UreJ family protein [Hyalangium versicolor]
MRMARLAAVLVLMLAVGEARAHDADILYAQVQRTQPGGPEVRARVTLTASTLSLLLPADADRDGSVSQADLEARRPALEVGFWDALPLTAGGAPCARKEHTAQVREGFVELAATFQCPPGPLRQTYTVLSILPSNYRVVLGTYGGEGGQLFADSLHPSLDIPERGTSPAQAVGPGLGGWIQLGMKHIFEGIDHLAFLIALLLVGGRLRQILWMVTSFTVAHSLTLGATALGFILLDAQRARWVEAAIALSIIYVAAENLVRREHRHRAVITFLFGLVHGFGFASALSAYGLGGQVASGLLGFNLGVELGQAAIVVALLPLVRLIQRRPKVNLWTVRVLSTVILGAGAWWLVERLG